MIPLLLQIDATGILTNAESLLFQALIYGLIPILMVFATLIRYSKRYFVEKQHQFKFQFAGEQWWMFYAIARYMSVVVVVLFGLILFWPGLYLNTSVAVPFQPLGFNFFLIVFTLMLVKGIDEDDRLHSSLRRLMLAGTSLYLIGTIILILCPQQLPLAQSQLYNSFSSIWMLIGNATNSQTNIVLATFSIYLNILVLLFCALLVLRFTTFRSKKPGKDR